ncbi:MAG: DUF1028 domain-containing protein [Vicinamibacterales bacterium]|nr:DUF1028 domain-containing protein [Vicinamibacterales bacterium]
MDNRTTRDSGRPPSPHGLPAGFGGARGARDSRLRHTACRPASAGQAGLGACTEGGEGREAGGGRPDVRIAARLLLGAAAAAFGVSLHAAFAVAQPVAVTGKPGPLAHTFSIVARDPATGEMGVAVQSHWFSVGSIVTWAEAGVGAVATQSFVDPSYGYRGLELMRTGVAAPEALKRLLAADAQRDVRQVAMVDAQGRVDAFSGALNIKDAGHRVGAQYSVQANMMANAKVWPAMAAAFEKTRGDLAERMLAALEAAQAAGGDIRGTQSAAMLIVRAKSSRRPWAGADRVFDLRVEDHPEPIPELRRLIRLQRAYAHANRGDELVSEKKIDEALKEYTAAGELAPEILELPFWQAVTLVVVGREAEAAPIFRRVFAKEPAWADLVPRLPAAGQLPDDPALISRIVALRAPK